MGFVDRIKGIKDVFSPRPSSDGEYIEIETGRGERAKILVRPFIMKEFEDIKDILVSIREGYTIALIDIKKIKEKDIIELKRAISKLKKTCDALDGDIAGIGDNFIVVTPSFAKIQRGEKLPVEEK